MLPRLQHHTDALIAALEGLGLIVGDGEAPDGAGYQTDGTFVPFVVVYPIPGGVTSGTLDRPNDDARVPIQVTCVGSSREQAEWLADRAMSLVESDLDVPGRRVLRVALDMFGGANRDDRGERSHWTAMPRFRLITTPAAGSGS